MGIQSSLFGKLTYINYFWGQDDEDSDNNFDDVEELFRSTQEIVEKKNMKVKFKKKRRSYAIRMSNSKKQPNKYESNDSPIPQGDGMFYDS